MGSDEVVDYFAKWFSTGFNTIEMLSIGQEGQCIENIITALLELGYRVPKTSVFTENLSTAIEHFQKDYKHRNVDGLFGPGTRRLLVKAVLEKNGLGARFFFERLKPSFLPFYRVFISYAHVDTEDINKIDYWLRAHDISVVRDIYDFQAGQQLPDEIRKYLHSSDKVIVAFSKASQHRDWPSFERFVAQEIESIRGVPTLIYVMIDASTPPSHDLHRIYIRTINRTLKEIGEDLLHGITGTMKRFSGIDYDENRPLRE